MRTARSVRGWCSASPPDVRDVIARSRYGGGSLLVRGFLDRPATAPVRINRPGRVHHPRRTRRQARRRQPPGTCGRCRSWYCRAGSVIASASTWRGRSPSREGAGGQPCAQGSDQFRLSPCFRVSRACLKWLSASSITRVGIAGSNTLRIEYLKVAGSMPRSSTLPPCPLAA